MRIVALLLAAAVSFAAQAVEHRPPGRLVDVGGRALHVHCTGSGTPTVVLEAGASSFATDWTLVQPVVAETQRVCFYPAPHRHIRRVSAGRSAARRAGAGSGQQRPADGAADRPGAPFSQQPPDRRRGLGPRDTPVSPGHGDRGHSCGQRGRRRGRRAAVGRLWQAPLNGLDGVEFPGGSRHDVRVRAGS